MKLRNETIHPKFIQLTTGHFREDNSYSNWRLHGTKDFLMILTLSGGGRVAYNSGEATTTENELILLRPGTLHDYGTAVNFDHWELVWAHFHPRPHWLIWLDFPEIAPGLSRLSFEQSSEKETIREQFFQINRLAASHSHRSEDFAMNSLELLLLLCDRENPNKKENSLDSRVSLALDFLCTHSSETLSIQQVADVCDLSVSRLAHLFKAQVGVTPLQFQERERLRRAKQLLELTSRSVVSISEEIGFASPFYFSNRFRKWTGVSPSQYRKG